MNIKLKTMLLFLIVSCFTNYLFFAGVLEIPKEPHGYSKKDRKAFDQLVAQYVNDNAADIFGYQLPEYIPDTKRGYADVSSR